MRDMRFGIAWLVVAVLFVEHSSAVTRAVACCSTANIVSTITASVTGDIVQLAADSVYSGSCATLTMGATKKLTLDGRNSRLNCINSSFVLTDEDNDKIMNLYLNVTSGSTGLTLLSSAGFTLDNVTFQGSGVGLVANASTPLLVSTKFMNNNATYGSAIRLDLGAAATVINCTFQNNKMATPTIVSRGAVHVQTGSLLVMSASRFIGNFASSGAALFLAGTARITNTTFQSNTALTTEGGAIYVAATGILSCTQGYFASNRATTVGGAISVAAGGNITLLNSIFISNTAVSNGGALLLALGVTNATVVNTQFISNTAANGGGVYTSASMTIATSQFSGNSATTNGGGLAFTSSITVNVSRTTFSTNSATGSGAGYYHDNGFLSLIGCSFISNTAGSRACGMTNGVPGVVVIQNVYAAYNFATSVTFGFSFANGAGTITNGTFIGNSGAQGGIFHATNAGTLSVSNVYAYDNSLTSTAVTGTIGYQGGTSRLTIVNSTFIALGTDDVYHRGILALASAQVIISGSTFSGFLVNLQTQDTANYVVTNSTFYNNGHVAWVQYSGTMSFDGCIFRNNVEGSVNSLYSGVIAVLSNAAAGAVTITNSVFDSNTGKNGGAIHMNPTNGLVTLLVRNCNFTNNYSLLRGGAIMVGAGTATISGCNFISNTVADNPQSSGGAVALAQLAAYTSAVSIDGSTFRSNKALLGGGFGVTQGAPTSPTVRDSAFYKNSATSHGGGVYAIGGTFTNLILSQNTANGNGGGLYAQTMTGTGLTVDHNVGRDGGGIYTSSLTNTSTITMANFQLNRASGTGGGVAVAAGVMTCSNFSSNTANAGGGIGALINGVASIDRCNVVNNYATTNGGGLAGALAGSLSIMNTMVSENTAGSSGGGVFSNFVASHFFLQNSEIRSNSGSTGGGVYVALGTFDANITSTTIQLNRAASGGGLAITGQTTVLLCNVSGNSATGSGGGVYATDEATLIDTVIANNIAVEAGGVSCQTCTMTMIGITVVEGNAASQDGGDLRCTIGSALTMDLQVSLHDNNVAPSPQFVDCSDCGCCPAPSNVILNQTDDCALSPGRSCGYYCPPGYTPANQTFVTEYPEFMCDLYGSLTPDLPCIPLPCPLLSAPTNGSASSVLEPVTGDRTSFACDQGFGRAGNESVLCVGPNWIGVIPICTPTPCPALTPPVNGSASRGDGSFGDTVVFTCQDGFLLRGVHSLQCGQNGWQGGNVPTCDSVPCTLLTAPMNGTIDTPASPASASVAYFTCAAGFGMSGSPNSTCLLGAWTSPAPTCVPLPCTSTVVVSANVQLLTPSAVTGESIYFACDEGYYMVGESSRYCQAPTYHGASPNCYAVFCNATRVPIPFLEGNCSTTVGYETLCAFNCPLGTGGEAFSSVCINTTTAPSGQFVPDIVPCAPCKAGTFAPDTSGVCVPCPGGGITLDSASTAQSDCQCIPGFYEATRGAGDCIECPIGGACVGGKERPVAASGYYSAGEAQFTKCFPSDACTGGDGCAPGYDGTFCGTCAAGFYRLNSICYPCPDNGNLRIAALMVALFIVVCVTVRLVRPSEIGDRTYGFVSISIGTAFIQIVATFSDIRINWPITTQNLFDAASVVNLNIEVAAPECIVALSFYQKIQIQLLLPIAFIVILVFVLLVLGTVQWIQNCVRHQTNWLAYMSRLFTLAVAAFTMLLNFSYLFLARASLRQFACTKNDDKWVVADAQTVECYTDEWRRNAILCGFGLVVYVFGIPAVIHLVYYVHLKKYGQFAAAASYFSHFLVAKYRPRTWAWELLIMARKLLMVVFACFWKSDTNAQIAASFGVLLVAMIATLPMSPYRWRKHNLAEGACLFASLAVLFSGILVSNADNKAVVVNVVTITVITIALGVLFIVLLLELKILYNVHRLRRSIDFERVCVDAAPNIVAVMPSKSSIITIGATGTLQEWTNKTLEEKRTIETGVRARMAVRRGRIVFVADDKGIVAISADRPKDRAYHKEVDVTAMALSAQYLISGNEKGDIVFWTFGVKADSEDSDDSSAMGHNVTSHELHVQLSQPQRMKSMHTHVAAMKRVGLFLYTVGNEGRVRKWNLQSRECFYAVQYHMAPGVSVTALEETGSTLIIGLSDGMIKYIHGVQSEEQRVQIKAVTALGLDDETLVTASADGSVVALGLEHGNYLQTLGRADYPIGSLAYDATGAVVWAEDSGKLWRVVVDQRWNVKDPDPNVFIALARALVCRCCKTAKQLVDSESGEEPEKRLYHQLDLLSQSLLFPTDLPWKSLGRQSADVIAGALAIEVSQRQTLQGSLRHPGLPQARSESRDVSVSAELSAESEAEASAEEEVEVEADGSVEDEDAAGVSEDVVSVGEETPKTPVAIGAPTPWAMK